MIPRLGRKPAHPPEHPHHRMRLASYLGASLPAPPDECLAWVGAVNGWELGRNDELGDCACVAPANAIRLWTANAGTMRVISQADIEAAYACFGGWDGTAGDASDAGCVISDVLAGWSNDVVGIGRDYLAAFAEVEHSDQDMIRRAVLLFGCCVIGVELPKAAQAWGTDPWPSVDGSQGLHGDLAPGSWGGHCALVVGYNALGALVVTWGRLVLIPWPTLGCYLIEAWACISADFLSANGVAPSGVDLALMRLDLAAMRDAG